jgi:hypothetical protein
LQYTWYTRPSLSAGSYFAVSQIHGAAPKIKIYTSGPAVCGSIEIVRQLEQDLEPYCVMFKELKGGTGGEQAASITVFLQRKEKH